jgi:prepilin-type N-terminal cleavage/methylation domain-containing protein/prepilin-type processing-associated H-X9-DG protein
MRNRGFTLIELLVVIAIIAILAAILFPVFAQARASAKTSMCTSNFKQVGTAITMYRDPFDRVWIQLLQPYVKEWHIFRCPSDVNNTDAALSKIDDNGACPPPKPGFETFYMWSLRSDAGFNYIYLSPVINQGAAKWHSAPLNESHVASAANTFLTIDSIWLRDASGAPIGGGNWVVVPPARYYRPPGGSQVDTFPFPPGTTQFYDYGGWAVNQPLSWLVFGGTWPWHRDRSMVTFVDGHTKTMRPTQLSNGVPNVLPNYGGPITDLDAYQWDVTQ